MSLQAQIGLIAAGVYVLYFYMRFGRWEPKVKEPVYRAPKPKLPKAIARIRTPMECMMCGDPMVADARTGIETCDCPQRGYRSNLN